MSGKYDQQVIDLKLIDPQDVKHLYKIRICRDRTLTITKGKQPPFNGVAIAILSVPTKQEAESLVRFVGKRQWTKLPETQQDWYKFMPDMEFGLLSYDDLPRMNSKLKFALNHMRKYRAEREAENKELQNA